MASIKVYVSLVCTWVEAVNVHRLLLQRLLPRTHHHNRVESSVAAAIVAVALEVAAEPAIAVHMIGWRMGVVIDGTISPAWRKNSTHLVLTWAGNGDGG